MSFLTDKIQLILDKINALLLWIGKKTTEGSKKALNKITPENLKRLEERLTKYVHERKKRPKPSDPIFKRVLKGIQQKIPIWKEKLSALLSKLITIFKALEPRRFIHSIRPWLRDKIMPLLYKLKAKYEAISPKTFAIGLILSIFILLASLNFYMATKKIVDETSAPEEIPIVEVKPRPPYYKATAKQIRLTDIKMPIYVQSAKDIKSLVMDFTLEASNRYIKKFFEKKTHYLQDQLNSTIEPIVPSFPLQPEGKEIIREKLIDESNKLIKRLNIKGRIEKVYFHNITAS